MDTSSPYGCTFCCAATDKQRLQDTLASTFMQASDQDMGFGSRPQACFSSLAFARCCAYKQH